MMIHLDPAVLEAFNISTSVSCKYPHPSVLRTYVVMINNLDVEHRGTGAHLLKMSSKRRRTKQELLLVAVEEEAQSQAQEEAK